MLSRQVPPIVVGLLQDDEVALAGLQQPDRRAEAGEAGPDDGDPDVPAPGPGALSAHWANSAAAG